MPAVERTHFGKIFTRIYCTGFFLQNTLRFTTKLSAKYKEFPHIPCPNSCIASPNINTPHQHVIFITDVPSLTHRCHPKFRVYTKSYSCCTFCVSGCTQKGTYPPLRYQTEGLPCPKTSPCSAYSCLPLHMQLLTFSVSPYSSVFSRM